MIKPAYRTKRYVLHPDRGWEDVNALAEELGWPLEYSTPRNQAEGADGQMTWQSASGVSLHYTVDATFGVGYLTLAGPDEDTVAPFTTQATNALEPWKLDELYNRFDNETDFVERGKLTIRIGLAAPQKFTEACFRRIKESLTGDDPRIQLTGVWASTSTGYQEFVHSVRQVAETASEEWLRTRAESVLAAFSHGK